MTSRPEPVAQSEVLQRITDIVPVLEANAAWQEEHRRLHDGTVEALRGAGVFRLRAPRQYGGDECDLRTIVDAGRILGRADGSTAFTVALWWITSWLVGMFPDEVQDEVFATEDVRICGTLAPTAMALPKDDGLVVNGEWNFNTGAAHSQWKFLSALTPTADGGMEPIMAVVPLDQVDIVDDWYVAGLQGTGSVSVVASDVYVPAGRWVRIGRLMEQDYASERNRGSRAWRTAMTPAISATTIGKLVGLAEAAQESFSEVITGRGIAYTDYMKQDQAAPTHLTVGEVAFLVEEARDHAYRLAALVDDKTATGAAWTVEERAWSRAVVGRVTDLASSAVNAVAATSGASSIYRSHRIGRLHRDVHAISIHGLQLPSSNYELYGRVLCGLAPNSTFI